MKIELSKPFTFEGKEYSSIEVKVEDLTGAQLKKACSDYAKLNQNIRRNPMFESSTMLTWSDDFITYFAGLQAGVPLEMLEALPVRDYVNVISRVRLF
ncbi:MAG: phage tail assembly protein [Succinivibrio sp.]|nr:phage tail assembly protein [Succinivibrio sp.]